MGRAFGGKRMNISVLIPIWKRHDLVEICFDYLAKQKEKFGFDVQIVGSEGIESESLTIKYGFNYLEFSNDNLGAKLNAGLGVLLNYDAVVVLGSDDFLSDEVWQQFEMIDLSGNIYYGFDHLYFYTTKDKKMYAFQYKGVNIKTMGAGRIYSKTALDLVDYKLWTDEKNHGLDTDASNRLKTVGTKEICLSGCKVMDVKHSHNITRHEVARVGKQCDRNNMSLVFSKDLQNKIENLVFVEGTETVNKKTIMKSTDEKVIIKMLKDAGGLYEGQELSTTVRASKHLIRMGTAIIISELSKETPVKKEKVVVVEKKERCIPCEQKDALAKKEAEKETPKVVKVDKSKTKK